MLQAVANSSQLSGASTQIPATNAACSKPEADNGTVATWCGHAMTATSVALAGAGYFLGGGAGIQVGVWGSGVLARYIAAGTIQQAIVKLCINSAAGGYYQPAGQALGSAIGAAIPQAGPYIKSACSLMYHMLPDVNTAAIDSLQSNYLTQLISSGLSGFCAELPEFIYHPLKSIMYNP